MGLFSLTRNTLFLSVAKWKAPNYIEINQISVNIFKFVFYETKRSRQPSKGFVLITDLIYHGVYKEIILQILYVTTLMGIGQNLNPKGSCFMFERYILYFLPSNANEMHNMMHISVLWLVLVSFSMLVFTSSYSTSVL